MFSQVEAFKGVKSGAGALAVGKAVNQTGNLLNIPSADLQVMTPVHLLGKTDHPGGAKKKRFGATGYNHMFDYPDLAIKNPTGNGQAYRATKGGYLPGNGGGGQAGYGCHDPHDYTFKEDLDLTMAKEVAMRQGTVMPHFVQPEHFMYHDKTKETIQERMTEMTEDYEREKIKHLYAQGFSEDEVMRYVEKKREKAIEQAEKTPYKASALMEATLARAMPTQLKEDYGNQSVAPGAIARRQDATAFERAINVGNPVAMKKKMEAQRQEQRIRGQIEHVEPIQVKEREPVMDMMRRLAKEAHGEVKPVIYKDEDKQKVAHVEEQRAKESVIEKQHAMMRQALENMGEDPRNL